MKYMTEKEYNLRLLKIQEKNLSKEQKLKLKEESKKFHTKRKLPSTSKIVLFGAILLCLQIVIFTEIIMWHTKDTSALYALIGIPVALAPIIWGYFSKTKAENTKGGITYDMAMANLSSEDYAG